MGAPAPRRPLTAAWALALLVALVLPAVAVADFPGGSPDEPLRLNAPDDPDFDRCEPDNEGGPECSVVYEQEYERFGFAPNSTQNTATLPPAVQRDRNEQENASAGRNPFGQIPGVHADRAWKRSTGDPSVDVAILDTGIRWRSTELRRKIRLNADELPRPRNGAAECARDDCDGDGAFTVDDFARDPRVSRTSGPHDEESDDLLDGSDLIAVFSDGRDDDGNGYTDDIAGWDFFDDDNDPFDASSYSAASNHGTGRADEAGRETDNGEGGTGLCPRCRIVPLRIWDTFVVDTNQFAFASLYAADNGIEVVEAAIGGLTSTRFVREAMRDAYRRGTFFAVVSSDLNTANHNSPTIYDEAMQVQGIVSDTNGLGEEAEVGSFLGAIGLPTQAPIRSWFRNSGTTQYGEHAHIVMPGTTGSQATGQASGAAGLVASYGRQRGTPLAPNEVKQLLTMTAEDVTAAHGQGLGVPDPAQPGWDRHFGYGKPDLGLALRRIAEGRIPPQALITSPRWFEPYEVGRESRVAVGGRMAARGGAYRWRLEWAPGAEPAEGEFRRVAGGTRTRGFDETFGSIDLRAVRAALDARPGGGSPDDPTEPVQPPGDVDPDEPAFTVRVVVEDADGDRGEDRKVLFAYRDGTLREGWPRRLDPGGEASPRMWDVDGDGRHEILVPSSSGELRVLRADGRDHPAWNGGRPVSTDPYPTAHPASPGLRRVGQPREPLRNPAIGDIDGDGVAEVVATAGERLYAWHLDGRRVRRFPRRVDPRLSAPELRTRENHVKRGFIASPTLGQLDPATPGLEIVAPALDGHVYVWDGDGRLLPGFPSRLRDPELPGAESINTAAVGDLTGDGRPEIVVASAEFDSATGERPDDPQELLRRGVIALLAEAIGGSGRVYALDAKGKVLDGWPVKPDGAIPDVLPLVAPGTDHVLADVDGEPGLEAIGFVTTGVLSARRADGSVVTDYDPSPDASGEHVDRSQILNFFEYPIAGQLVPGGPPEVFKGGLTLNQAVNLGILTGQNLPYNHVLQGWNGRDGSSLPGFPQAVEDFQLLSTPSLGSVTRDGRPQVLVGTGRYLLRAFDAGGREPATWPKFTGGWIFATPAHGDVDGDGRDEIAVTTREGNAFLWETDGPACGDGRWPTSRHDEHSSGALGTDARPPATAAGLRARRRGRRDLRVSWREPGDDARCGRARRFRLQTSRCPIRSPQDGAVLASLRAGDEGARRFIDIHRRSGRQEVAVSYVDEAGNWSLPARVVTPGGGRRITRRFDVDRPRIRVRAPARAPRTRPVRVQWRGSDRRTGIACYEAQVRQGRSRRWRPLRREPGLRAIQHQTQRRNAALRVPAGGRALVRVRAHDGAGNRSGWRYVRIAGPRRAGR